MLSCLVYFGEIVSTYATQLCCPPLSKDGGSKDDVIDDDDVTVVLYTQEESDACAVDCSPHERREYVFERILDDSAHVTLLDGIEEEEEDEEVEYDDKDEGKDEEREENDDKKEEESGWVKTTETSETIKPEIAESIHTEQRSPGSFKDIDDRNDLLKDTYMDIGPSLFKTVQQCEKECKDVENYEGKTVENYGDKTVAIYGDKTIENYGDKTMEYDGDKTIEYAEGKIEGDVNQIKESIILCTNQTIMAPPHQKMNDNSFKATSYLDIGRTLLRIGDETVENRDKIIENIGEKKVEYTREKKSENREKTIENNEDRMVENVDEDIKNDNEPEKELDGETKGDNDSGNGDEEVKASKMGDDDRFNFKGRVVKSFSTQYEPVGAACISPDQRTIVSCHREIIILWDSSRCEEYGRLEGHRSDITCCSIGDTLLATGSANGIVHLWKYRDLKRVARIGLPSSPISTVAISPNGQLLSIGFADGKPRLYHLNSGDGAFLQGPSYKELQGHRDGITHMKFSSSSVNLLTTSKDGTIRLWKVSTGDNLLTIDPGEGVVMKADYSGGSNIVYLTEVGFTVWSLTSDEKLWQIEGGFQLLASNNFTHAIATITANSRLSCFNISTQKETVKKGTAHSDDIVTCVTCPSGKYFLTGGADGKLFLWE